MRAKSRAVLALAALTLAACGGGGDSDEEQVRKLVETFYSSGEDVCDAITEKLRDDQFASKEDCEEAAQDAEPEDDYEIERVEVGGDSGEVDVKVGDQIGTLLVKKDDGDWKVDGIKQRERGDGVQTAPGG